MSQYSNSSIEELDIEIWWDMVCASKPSKRHSWPRPTLRSQLSTYTSPWSTSQTGNIDGTVDQNNSMAGLRFLGLYNSASSVRNNLLNSTNLERLEWSHTHHQALIDCLPPQLPGACPYHAPILEFPPLPTSSADDSRTPLQRFIKAPPSEDFFSLIGERCIGSSASAGCLCGDTISQEMIDEVTKERSQVQLDDITDLFLW